MSYSGKPSARAAVPGLIVEITIYSKNRLFDDLAYLCKKKIKESIIQTVFAANISFFPLYSEWYAETLKGLPQAKTGPSAIEEYMVISLEKYNTFNATPIAEEVFGSKC